MKYDPEATTARLTSEGKILELTPLLYGVDGSLMSLPPVIYRCPNWLLGFDPEHIIGYPYTIHFNERTAIPSNPRNAPMLSFLVRLYESAPGIVSGEIPEITEEWAAAFATLSLTAKTDITRRIAALEARNN